jgi:1-deoxy-D-xylulose-5-phosphate synthase
MFGEGVSTVTVVTFGRITKRVISAVEKAAAMGIPCRLIRFFALKGYDKKEAFAPFLGCKNLLFVEEGIVSGGFSENLLQALRQEGITPEGEVRILGVSDTFVPHGKTDELLTEIGLEEENIIKEIENLAKTGSVLI